MTDRVRLSPGSGARRGEERGLGGNGRAPAENRTGRAVIDLQRQGQPRDRGAEPGQPAQRGEDRVGQREEPWHPALPLRQETDQRRRSAKRPRQRASSTRPAAAGWTAAARDEIDEVVDENQAAAVVERGERQRQAAAGEPDQGPEIAPTPGP